jgi:hypothetical protein
MAHREATMCPAVIVHAGIHIFMVYGTSKEVATYADNQHISSFYLTEYLLPSSQNPSAGT